jgi:uncharacterized membrane-anchored protein
VTRTLVLAIPLALLLVAAAAPADAEQIQHSLPRGSLLTTDQADEVVVDRDQLDTISRESQGSVDPSLEAHWTTADFEVFFSYDPVGYVAMDDWDDLDVDDLWASYVDGAKEQSEVFGYEVRPLGWIIQPTLDRVNSVAYYAIEFQFGDEPPIINMAVYSFGRHGYEEMTFVQDGETFSAANANTIARRIASAYEFGTGKTYADFRAGDKIAAVGAGGIIAAALGVKFGKGLLMIALLFMKKLWFLIILVPATLWKFVRTRFS